MRLDHSIVCIRAINPFGRVHRIRARAQDSTAVSPARRVQRGSDPGARQSLRAEPTPPPEPAPPAARRPPLPPTRHGHRRPCTPSQDTATPTPCSAGRRKPRRGAKGGSRGAGAERGTRAGGGPSPSSLEDREGLGGKLSLHRPPNDAR
jgi:hypothetical protein